MSAWAAIAHPHIGHRVVLKDVFKVRCVDCSMDLLIPRDTPPVAPLPPRWQPEPGGRPMPPDFREQYQAHRRRKADG